MNGKFKGDKFDKSVVADFTQLNLSTVGSPLLLFHMRWIWTVSWNRRYSKSCWGLIFYNLKKFPELTLICAFGNKGIIWPTLSPFAIKHAGSSPASTLSAGIFSSIEDIISIRWPRLLPDGVENCLGEVSLEIFFWAKETISDIGWQCDTGIRKETRFSSFFSGFFYPFVFLCLVRFHLSLKKRLQSFF